jgi:acetate kinase
MPLASPRVLTINGGSSSIKFALFEVDESLRRILHGGISKPLWITADVVAALHRLGAFDAEHIFATAARVAVRVIYTDEERVIAEAVCSVLDLGPIRRVDS